jgi:hypothetical protein
LAVLEIIYELANLRRAQLIQSLRFWVCANANYLQFNNLNVPTAGLYRMTINYASDEVYTDPEGGAVFRYAQINVNGGTAQQVYFDNTFSWNTFEPIEVDVQLNAGNNTIRFSNNATSPTPNLDSGWVPVIATIQIAGSE